VEENLRRHSTLHFRLIGAQREKLAEKATTNQKFCVSHKFPELSGKVGGKFVFMGKS